MVSDITSYRNMRKKILISIPFPRMIRFFLDTDLFKSLTSENIDILIVHNQKDISHFINGYPNVSAVSYPIKGNKPRIVPIFRYFINAPALTKRIFRSGKWEIRGYFLRSKNLLEKIMIFGTIMLMDIIYCIPYFGLRIFRQLFYDKNYEKFLVDHGIQGIILTAPMLDDDRLFAEAAFRCNIPAIIGTDGWDTLTNFGYLHKYKGVIVWGPEMAKQAESQGYDERQIVYSGIPYKEKLCCYYENADVQAIKKKYDLPDDEKVILIFANNWYAQGDIEKRNIELILNAITRGKLQKVKLLIRLLPKKNTPEEQYYRENYWNNPHIRFQIPSDGYNEKNRDAVPENLLQEVAELFAISDLTINILSMALLEAAIVGVQGIICNYSDIVYPSRYVTEGDIYRSLIQNGIIEVRNSDLLIPTIIKCLQKSEVPDLQKAVIQWDYKEPGVEKKILSLLSR